ncbi:unnamed protein product [marine sediment metagenome]|uniref:Uncharacterized protein n=1 Tax=marine sediment metagenome TaxID=412755 RepID=X0WZV8_9ZZZZ
MEHFFFGWYLNYDYGVLPRTTYWRRSKNRKWDLIRKRYRGPDVTAWIIDD